MFGKWTTDFLFVIHMQVVFFVGYGVHENPFFPYGNFQMKSVFSKRARAWTLCVTGPKSAQMSFCKYSSLTLWLIYWNWQNICRYSVLPPSIGCELSPWVEELLNEISQVFPFTDSTTPLNLLKKSLAECGRVWLIHSSTNDADVARFLMMKVKFTEYNQADSALFLDAGKWMMVAHSLTVTLICGNNISSKPHCACRIRSEAVALDCRKRDQLYGFLP